MDKYEQKYRNTLIQMVDYPDRRYKFLLEVLWDKEFYSLIDFDDNRAKDGVSLREKMGYQDVFGPCRVLEMLIFLAKRCAFQLYGSSFEISYEEMFWELIGNLGLDIYTKHNWTDDKIYFEIDEILNVWLDREYCENGEGGVFPLVKPDKNQRELEIWYQMQCYLLERQNL